MLRVLQEYGAQAKIPFRKGVQVYLGRKKYWVQKSTRGHYVLTRLGTPQHENLAT